MLYVALRKAVYGTLKAALLFYQKLLGELEAVGFKLNPYDPCVANKEINGSQMTVCWHVDDLKISHVDKRCVSKIIKYLDGIYPGVTITRGKIHEYLGMTFDFSTKGAVKISMVDYTKKIIEGFPEEITRTSPTPAADHLFQVRSDDDKEKKLLPEEQAGQYHTVTAQLLFLAGRARRDIQTAVAFLTTRVKAPDEDDWGKLKRVLQYLRGTLHAKLTLTADSLLVIKWWVDASFAVHPDCRGHSGGIMSFGGGAVISGSRKQKLNGKSSTDNEIIGVDDFMGQILYTLYFMRAQGYDVTHNILFQDNQSCMQLLINGRASGSKKVKAHQHQKLLRN